MIHFLSLLSLFAPLTWEVIDDASGEAKKNKAPDVLIRLLIASFAALLNYVIINKPIIDSFLLSMAIHFFFFDYIIQYILIKRGVIETNENFFTYLGKTAEFDTFELWVRLGPKRRFFVRAGVLIAAIVIWIVNT